MDQVRECEHKDRAYANFIYATYPSQHPWICKDCGYEGIDSGIVMDNSYDTFIKKFRKLDNATKTLSEIGEVTVASSLKIGNAMMHAGEIVKPIKKTE